MTARFLLIVTLALSSAIALPTAIRAQTKNQAVAWFNEARQQSAAGQYAKAAELYERVVRVGPQLFGAGSEDYALAMNNLGDAYLALGRYTEAEPPLKRSLAIYEARLGKDAIMAGVVVNNLALLCHYTSRYAEAEPLYQRSLAIKVARLGKGHADTALALNNLAGLYQEIGRYSEAEALCKQSLAIREAQLGKDHPDIGQSLNNLAVLCYATGRYAEAEALSKRSLDIRVAKLGPNHADVALALNNMAELYRHLGRYTEAEPFYKRSSAAYETSLGPAHPATANALNNLAGMYQDLGRYAEAEPLYKRSLAVREAKLGKDHPDTAVSLNNLAMLYRATTRNAEAEPLFDRALAITVAKKGMDHPQTASFLDNLARLYQATGRPVEAETNFKRALAIREVKWGKDHPDAASSLNNLAVLYQDLGRHAEAEPLYRRADSIYETKQGPDHPAVANALNNLARLYYATGRFAEAAEAIDRARRGTRRHVGRVLPILSEKEQLAFFRLTDEDRLLRAYSLALQHPETPGLAERSSGWLLNAKGVAQQSLAQGNLAARDSRDPAAAGTVRLLLDTRRALARLSVTTPKPGTEEIQRRRRDELTAREQELAKQLQRGGAAVEAGDPWVEPEALRQALPAKSVFVDLARFKEFDSKAERGKQWKAARYVAWVTPKVGPVKVVDLGPADAIDAAVAAARRALDDTPAKLKTAGEPEAEKAARVPLAALAKLVLRPLREHVDAADGWIICPDAQLWLAPWAALPLDDTTYAIEKHAIQLVVSGRDLIPKPVVLKPVAAPTMFADPDFDASPASAPHVPVKGDGTRSLRGLKLGRVPRLPGTAAEAEAVTGQWRALFRTKPTLLTEREATTTAFTLLNRPRLLALATHGFFLPEQEYTAEEKEKLARNPDFKPATRIEDPLLRCGLLLAGCNAPSASDTGVLTGREVLSADLRGCQMVVLSACETGLGDVRQGEGVAGLRQAFLLAGADSVLASLWQVPDFDTALLMNGLFESLGQGTGRAEALRQSQLKRIAARRSKFGAAHPFFWAAFTLTGDAGALSK